ncbi:hypothetical protein R1sor_013308 [Riccia sorocarpa]|uniref:Transposase n=1 Tax=Riccia sorocarpa TaxID=122646 RepID=A0ABD3H8Z8_9MARC
MPRRRFASDDNDYHKRRRVGEVRQHPHCHATDDRVPVPEDIETLPANAPPVSVVDSLVNESVHVQVVDDTVPDSQATGEPEPVSEEEQIDDTDDRPGCRLPAKYGLWSRSNIEEFFSRYQLLCPRPGCALSVLQPIVKEFQQIWLLTFSCPRGHRTTFNTGEMELVKG